VFKVTRRQFVVGAFGALGAGVTGAILGPIAAFLLSPLLKQAPETWRDIGAPDDFEPGTTTKVTFQDSSSVPWSGQTAKSAAWLRRGKDGSFQAFAINCTHLGCPVRWEAGPQLFMCPCHGGVFYEDGTVAAPPPKQRLPQHETRVIGGRLEIKTRPLEITGDVLKGTKS
jgi:quinol---cytochrome c reductase iron-sulfur subunit, bacillus type